MSLRKNELESMIKLDEINFTKKVDILGKKPTISNQDIDRMMTKNSQHLNMNIGKRKS